MVGSANGFTFFCWFPCLSSRNHFSTSVDLIAKGARSPQRAQCRLRPPWSSLQTTANWRSSDSMAMEEVWSESGVPLFGRLLRRLSRVSYMMQPDGFDKFSH